MAGNVTRLTNNSLRLVVMMFVLITGQSASAQQQGSSSKVQIWLKEQVVHSSSHVKLGDVCTITDHDRNRRAALQDLDLAVLKPDQDLKIERSLIEIRLKLAGYDTDQMVFQGARETLVQHPPEIPLTDLGVEQAVHEALCRQFSVIPEDLRVKMISPLIGNGLPELSQIRQPRLELLPSPQLPIGRVQLTVRILDRDRVVAARAVSFEIARRQPVVVANLSLDRNTIVGPEHVREEYRFVDAPTDRLTASQVIGRRVAIPFRPDEVLTLRHIGQVAEAESPILIQPRDPVRLIAKKNNLTVTIPVAEAMQAGRQGQLIRVKNLQSNQIVTGVVAGRGEVHVILP